METSKELNLAKFTPKFSKISERTYEKVKAVAKHNILYPTNNLTNYDFCQPKSKLFPVYNSFMDQYRTVLSGKIPSNNVLRRAIALVDAQLNAQGNIPTPARKSKQKIEEPGINWQDFVVLETIEFFTSDLNGKSNLPPPLSLEEMQAHTLKEAKQEIMLKSPFTGELIPSSKFDEHVKIHSIDPRWKEQKTKEIDRELNTNLDMENAAEKLNRLREKKRKLMEDDM